ncbi:ribonuclease H-like domain-containing protein [Tanacetum coccineum]
MDFKEKRLVSHDKSKIECYNCYRKMHFARECRSGRSQGRRSYGDNGRNNVPTNESSSQALVAQDGLGGYDLSNDFEVEPVNYALMAISSSSSSSSSNSEVQKCSKCLESFKCLQKNYDTEREKHNKAKLEIRGYEIALESLESRIIRHEKNELAWEKAVKERDELKDKIAKWEESTKNLEEILKSQMSARDKTGLGYSTQLNELSSNHETDSENSLSIFDGRSSDDEHIPENDRFSKNRKMVVDSGCSSHMTGNKAYLSDYEDFNGGFVAFGSNPKEAAHEKASESSPKDNDIQDSEDVIDKEGQHQMPEDEQVLHDELKKMRKKDLLMRGSTPRPVNADVTPLMPAYGRDLVLRVKDCRGGDDVTLTSNLGDLNMDKHHAVMSYTHTPNFIRIIKKTILGDPTSAVPNKRKFKRLLQHNKSLVR